MTSAQSPVQMNLSLRPEPCAGLQQDETRSQDRRCRNFCKAGKVARTTVPKRRSKSNSCVFASPPLQFSLTPHRPLPSRRLLLPNSNKRAYAQLPSPRLSSARAEQ
eukprot:4091817-Pleurochrysis_carterae.AAC.1